MPSEATGTRTHSPLSRERYGRGHPFLMPMSRRSVLKGLATLALLTSGASCAVSGSSASPAAPLPTPGSLLLTYQGHTARVTSVMWSPDGKRIAFGSLDKTVQVWDATTGQVLYRYRGYNVEAARLNPIKGVLPEIILAVAWLHNGKRLAAVTQEYCGDVCGVMLIWDALTERHVSFYPDIPIYALAWSPDDTRLISTVGIVVQIT